MIIVLLIQLTCLLRNARTNYYDPFYQPAEQDYPSQEDTSDMDHGHDHHHHHERSNHNYNHDQDYEAEGKLRRYSYEEDECYSCACNKCDNPPQCCKQVCESCPKRPVIAPPPQMQMPMQQIPMSMPHMQMTMPQMPMQMPPNPLAPSFSSSIPGQNLVFFPFPTNFVNLLKQITPAEVKKPDVQTTTEATTTTEAPTTTTTQATTTTTTPPPPPPEVEEQTENYKPPNQYLRNRYDNSMLESVLKGNIDAISNIIMKNPEKARNAENKYMLTALRKTKPTWVPKFGIVPISDNMAEKLMSQLRDVKGLRRRPKRVAVFETE
ncbi:uncharacterized protein LOC142977761 isoform X2 [Anticarsia gemmatalis]|uniref:uncharacterized protein LOC142977761 isoform X2 n=1 Tax=Anticarsia gemmatalis TaxID=129554 RepID=UPI003F77341F